MSPEANFLYSFGPVLVYERYPNPFMPFQKIKYYWKYQDGQSIYGPFENMAVCAKHYETCLLTSGRVNEQIKDNLIIVDFKHKRRLK
jgi:hypothetical protein